MLYSPHAARGLCINLIVHEFTASISPKKPGLFPQALRSCPNLFDAMHNRRAQFFAAFANFSKKYELEANFFQEVSTPFLLSAHACKQHSHMQQWLTLHQSRSDTWIPSNGMQSLFT
jgi:hypothetical protein